MNVCVPVCVFRVVIRARFPFFFFVNTDGRKRKSERGKEMSPRRSRPQEVVNGDKETRARDNAHPCTHEYQRLWSGRVCSIIKKIGISMIVCLAASLPSTSHKKNHKCKVCMLCACACVHVCVLSGAAWIRPMG